MSSDFYFQNFFPKNLAKKLGRVLQWRISGTARVRVRFCSTPPPFRADENTRGSFLPPASGGVPAGVFLSARIPVAFRRRAPTVPVARCGITNFSLQKFYPYLQPHPSLRRTAFLATFLPHLTLRDAIRTRGIFGQSPLGSPYNAWRDACTQPRSTGRVCFWLSTGGPSSGAIWQRSGIIMFPGRTTRCESDAPMWARVWVDADEPRISL